MRVDGDPQVYLIANDQAAQLKKHLGDLRDTTLLAFDPSKAQKLVIATAGKKTVLAKEGGVWKMLEPKTPPKDFVFEPSLVDRELGQLQALRAAAIADVPEAKAGFAKPSGTVEISLEGGTSQLLKFGGDSSTGIYVKGTADGFVYTIDRGARTRLESPLEIFKKPPAPPDMGQMRGLENLPPEIRKQLEAQLRQQRH